jgi:hypothetical protein
VVKPLTFAGMRYVVRAIVRISGVRNRFEFKGEVQMSRGFRKFYKSEADQSGMLPATVELTQGHSIGMPGHYLRLKDTEILRDYEKVIDRITLDPSHRLKKRVDELETEKEQTGHAFDNDSFVMNNLRNEGNPNFESGQFTE